jgi:acetylornithine deacetylase
MTTPAENALTQTAVTELLARLVAIDSVNPDLVPGGAGEAAIAAFVAEWLERAGLEVRVEPLRAGRANVIAVARGRRGGPALMLNAHLDTVGVAGCESPHEPVMREGKLYGRGACDTKGALAAFMLAAAAARREGLAGDVILTAVADEEYLSIGTEAVLANGWRAAAAIVGEPTNLTIATAHKGFAWLEVETRGVAAHGSDPNAGVDAILHMGRVLAGLARLDAALRAGPRDPLLGPGSLHASLIDGGQEYSSYPERCRLRLERRTLPGETPQRVEDDVRAILAPLAAEDPAFRATVTTRFARAGLAVDPNARIVRLLRRHGAAVLGSEPPVVGMGFWTDAALLAEAGIPAVVFGPLGAGLHGAVEWVDLASVHACAEIALAAARDMGAV